MNDNLNSTYDTDMPDFSNVEYIKSDGVKSALTKFTEASQKNLQPWVETLTSLINFAYKEGLETGYEIAIERQKGK